jgi:hypothetical protein
MPCSEAVGCFDWLPVPDASGEAFSDEIPSWDDIPFALPNPMNRRLILADEGELLTPVGSFDGEPWVLVQGTTYTYDRRYGYDCPALTSTPYMRWDRAWQVVPLESEGSFLLLDGEVEGSLSATITRGVSTTEATTFSETTTESAGLDFMGLGIALEESFTEGYTMSVTINEESSATFTQTVQGTNGATSQFMVWQLVDRFTVTDATGETLADPNYGFPPVILEVRGAKALKVTVFPH